MKIGNVKNSDRRWQLSPTRVRRLPFWLGHRSPRDSEFYQDRIQTSILSSTSLLFRRSSAGLLLMNRLLLLLRL